MSLTLAFFLTNLEQIIVNLFLFLKIKRPKIFKYSRKTRQFVN